jgi:hypothetical protein
VTKSKAFFNITHLSGKAAIFYIYKWYADTHIDKSMKKGNHLFTAWLEQNCYEKLKFSSLSAFKSRIYHILRMSHHDVYTCLFPFWHGTLPYAVSAVAT